MLKSTLAAITSAANAYACMQCPEENSYGRPADQQRFDSVRDAKFAELVILHCAFAAGKNDGTEEEWVVFFNEHDTEAE